MAKVNLIPFPSLEITIDGHQYDVTYEFLPVEPEAGFPGESVEIHSVKNSDGNEFILSNQQYQYAVEEIFEHDRGQKNGC